MLSRVSASLPRLLALALDSAGRQALPTSIKGMKNKPPATWRRKMTTTNEKQNTIRLGNSETTWSDLLRNAVSTPGKLLEAYTAFHNFSVGNSLLAMFQCHERKITPGPLNTYKGWHQLGRQVRKGEKAITLCMPLAYKEARPPREPEHRSRHESGDPRH
jgi:hypothetical protein